MYIKRGAVLCTTTRLCRATYIHNLSLLALMLHVGCPIGQDYARRLLRKGTLLVTYTWVGLCNAVYLVSHAYQVRLLSWNKFILKVKNVDNYT